MYSTMDRDLLQVERDGQQITTQLLTALAETPEEVAYLAAFNCPASRACGSADCICYHQGEG